MFLFYRGEVRLSIKPSDRIAALKAECMRYSVSVSLIFFIINLAFRPPVCKEYNGIDVPEGVC